MLESLIEAVTSVTAQKLLTGVSMASLFGLSVFVAYDQANWVTATPKSVSFLGRPPTRSKSILKRLNKVRQFRTQIFGRMAVSGLMIVLWGVIIPALILTFFALNIEWFLPGARAFATAAPCAPNVSVTTPSDADIVSLIAYQTWTALAVDAFAGYAKIPLPRISWAEANPWLAAMTMAYRLYLGGYVVNWLRTLAIAVFNMFRSKEIAQQIEVLERQYKAALEKEKNT